VTEVSEQTHPQRRESPLTSPTGLDLLLFAWLTFAIVLTTALAKQPGGDWSFFVAGGHTLGSDRWAHLYVDNHNAQTGPITFALAWLLDPLGLAAVRLAIMLLGVAVMGLLVWSTRGVPNVRWRLAIGGTALALWWPQMSFFGHLDDALVLGLGLTAVVVARRERATTAGVLAGVAVGVKPTAVFLLALALPRTAWRSAKAWVPFAVAVAVSVIWWLPFVIGDSGTLDALKPKVVVTPDSVLALLGQAGELPSAAFRAAQLLAVLGLASLAMLRRGPAAVMLVGIAARLLLDPAAWPYYTAGFVLGALVWEAYESRHRLPWATLAGAVLLAPRWLVHSDTLRAWMRLVACVGAIAVVLVGWGTGQRAGDDRSGRSPAK
jgi:hypothetical protein